jgi:hypothetical protein
VKIIQVRWASYAPSRPKLKVSIVAAPSAHSLVRRLDLPTQPVRPSSAPSLAPPTEMSAADAGVPIPGWVASLADDHIKSLRMLFQDADQKQAELDAIEARSSFPGVQALCLDVELSRAAPVSVTAVDAAESLARGEHERLLARVATARIELTRSMASTLQMMCGAMERRGGAAVSAEQIVEWSRQFDVRLRSEILGERRRLKANRARRRRKRRPELTSSRHGLIEPSR